MPTRFVRPTFVRPTFDAILCHLLQYLLLVAYILLLYGVVILLLLALRALPAGNSEIAFLPPWWVSSIALIIIAPTLPTVHRWLRVNLNALIYGEHDDPYALLAEVNVQLQSMTSLQTTLPGVAATLARAMKLPYVAITASGGSYPSPLAQSDQLVQFETGRCIDERDKITLPLTYLDMPLGKLAVSTRQRGESLSEKDRTLLEDVARQLGVALHVLQLAADLQRSRVQLVLGREEERRRIRNDLHDGLGPTLSSLQLQLGTLQNLIRQAPERAEQIAGAMRVDLRQATADIRQLVYDLRPPLLDELGLVEAIRAMHIPDTTIKVEVVAPPNFLRLPAALEVATYRIAREAIHNVIRHAHATHCTVHLQTSAHTLTLVVRDNGTGLPTPLHVGVGFASMRERAAELGGTLMIQPGDEGGVTVTAHFPLAE